MCMINIFIKVKRQVKNWEKYENTCVPILKGHIILLGLDKRPT